MKSLALIIICAAGWAALMTVLVSPYNFVLGFILVIVGCGLIGWFMPKFDN